MAALIDTNVLVYRFDSRFPEKQKIATNILRRGIAEALEAVTTLLKFPIVEVSPSLIVAAARRSQTDSMSFWDSLIIEAALKSGSQRLWSEDLQHGRTLEGMRIENSFLQA